MKKYSSESSQTRVVKVFISSTFKDLQSERAHLFDQVFPAIKDFCKKKNIILLERDLRWGITEEEAKNGNTVEICMDSINEARPFFIGILGNRYGWIPEEGDISKDGSLFDRFPEVKEYIKERKSITEMEFLYGALSTQNDVEAAFFIKNDSHDYEGLEAKEKLKLLKEKILSQNRYEKYSFNSSEELGEKVFSYMTNAIARRFPEEKLTSTQIVDANQKMYIQQQANLYVCRKNAEKSFEKFINSEIGIGIIYGISGCGKSMFISSYVNRIIKEHQPINLIVCKIGLTNETTGKYGISEYLYNKIIEITGEKPTKRTNIGNEDDNISSWLSNALNKITEPNKVIIILDGLDDLDTSDETHLLKWLPPMPTGLKIVFTSRTIQNEGFYYYSVKGTGHLFRISFQTEIEELTSEEIAQMSLKYLMLYGKKLDKELISLISKSPVVKRASALRLLLDELRYYGNHEHLAEYVNKLVSANTESDLISLVLNRISEIVFPHNSESLSKLFSVVYASRYGIMENELTSILKMTDFQMAIFNALSGSLFVERDGLLSGADWVKENVVNHFNIDNQKMVIAHQEILEYFSQGNNKHTERVIIEVPWQLLQLEKFEELKEYASSTEVFENWFNKDPEHLSECLIYWKPLIKNGMSLDIFSTIPVNINNIDAIYHLSVFAEDMGDYDSERVFLKKSLDYYQGVDMDNHERLGYIGNIAHRMAKNSFNLGNYNESQIEFDHAIEVFNEYGLPSIVDMAQTLIDYGLMYYRISEYDKAIEKYEESERLYYRMQELHLPFPMIAPSFGLLYTNLAIVWMQKNETESENKAIGYADMADAIAQKLLDYNPQGMAEQMIIIETTVLGIYIGLKEIDKARTLKKVTESVYRELAEKFPHRAGLKYGEFLTNYATGIVYNKKDKQEAKQCYLLAINLLNSCYSQMQGRMTSNMGFGAFAYYYLAYLFKEENDTANALESLKSSIILASELYTLTPQTPEILDLSVSTIINDNKSIESYPDILTFIINNIGKLFDIALSSKVQRRHLFNISQKIAEAYMELEEYGKSRAIYTKAFQLLQSYIDSKDKEEVSDYFRILSLIAYCAGELNDSDFELKIHKKIINEGCEFVTDISIPSFLYSIISSGQYILSLGDKSENTSLLANVIMLCYSKLSSQDIDYDVIQMLEVCNFLCGSEIQKGLHKEKAQELDYIIRFALQKATQSDIKEGKDYCESLIIRIMDAYNTIAEYLT